MNSHYLSAVDPEILAHRAAIMTETDPMMIEDHLAAIRRLRMKPKYSERAEVASVLDRLTSAFLRPVSPHLKIAV